jgi:pimeloyl-ACP methyl ester carboxylesterase
MKLHSVPVAGGALAVEELPGSTQPVLAVHGVSSQRKLWSWLRAEAPEISLLAPDLRGRGDSVDVAGPSSMAQHAEDMVAVLDALGLDAVHVVGMSMGGFVAVHLAHLHPERVKSLVLVDGGFPMAALPGLTREMLPVVFKDRLDRLEQRWDSLDDYLAFFTGSTTPLLDPEDPLLREYLAHDLRDGLVRLSGQALLDDAADIYLNETPWRSLTQPVRLSYAQWSTGPGTSPAYPEEALRTYLPATVSSRYVEGQDHAGSIMTKAGAVAAAELLAEALG